jgi:hypothetical protein
MAKYIVIGALGGVGQEIVRRLAERPAKEVAEIRAIDNRKLEDNPGCLPEDPRILSYKGDYRQPHSVKRVCPGASGIFFAASTELGTTGGGKQRGVDALALDAVGRLAREAGIRRIVMVSRRAEVDKAGTRSVGAKSADKETSVDPFDLLLLAEQRIRETEGIEYCIVRLGRLTEKHETCTDKAIGRAPLRVGQYHKGDLAEDLETTRADAALVCLCAMTTLSFKNTTFDLISDKPLSADAPDEPRPTQSFFSKLDSNWDKHLELPGDEILQDEEENLAPEFEKPAKLSVKASLASMATSSTQCALSLVRCQRRTGSRNPKKVR